MRLKLIILCLIAALPGLSLARPAPWYWWASSVGEARICAQTSPGSGWLKEPRAFRDAHCSIRL